MIPGTKQILVVDDDPDVLATLAQALTAEGYGVMQALDSQQGLALARAHHPDLVLMDVMLTDRKGDALAIHHFREESGLRDIPLFAMSCCYSGREAFPLPESSDWLAHDELLGKPVDLLLLLRKIRERIGSAQPAKEMESGGSHCAP